MKENPSIFGIFITFVWNWGIYIFEKKKKKTSHIVTNYVWGGGNKWGVMKLYEVYVYYVFVYAARILLWFVGSFVSKDVIKKLYYQNKILSVFDKIL